MAEEITNGDTTYLFGSKLQHGCKGGCARHLESVGAGARKRFTCHVRRA